MSWPAKHPGPWRCEFDEDWPATTDWPILDANGEPVVVTDSGFYPPDPETARAIVDAMNGRAAARRRARAANPVRAARRSESGRRRSAAARSGRGMPKGKGGEMKPVLNLTIRRKWLDMIASGEKREEYRRTDNAQVVRAWSRWLNSWPDDAVAVLRAGYTMRAPAVVVEVVAMTIRGARDAARPDWGEERGVARFVLKLGRVLRAGEYADVRAWMEAQG